jgi:hypothetical protein
VYETMFWLKLVVLAVFFWLLLLILNSGDAPASGTNGCNDGK